MATEKVLNYTPEMTATLVEEYVAAPTKETVEALAEKFGRTTKSVIAKLVREGVYKSPAKEAGKRVATKADLVADIAKLVGKSEEQMESLEKATAPALTAVRNALFNLASVNVALRAEAQKAE